MGSAEENVSEPKTLDMVSELSNILCGNLLSYLDKRTPYTVTIPRGERLSRERAQGEFLQGGILVDFGAEADGVRLMVQLDHPKRGRVRRIR